MHSVGRTSQELALNGSFATLGREQKISQDRLVVDTRKSAFFSVTAAVQAWAANPSAPRVLVLTQTSAAVAAWSAAGSGHPRAALRPRLHISFTAGRWSPFQ